MIKKYTYDEIDQAPTYKVPYKHLPDGTLREFRDDMGPGSYKICYVSWEEYYNVQQTLATVQAQVVELLGKLNTPTHANP